MSLDLVSVLIGASISAITSYAIVKYQVDNMTKLEVKKLKWDRYSDKLLALSEYVSKVAFLIPRNIDKEELSDSYFEDVSALIGSSMRWIHYQKLSELLAEFEDFAFDALIGYGGNIKKEQRDRILEDVPRLASDIQKEIDRIFDV